MQAEIADKANFERIRYAQCWEDADVLLEAIEVTRAGTYLSIASAGDNTLALVKFDKRMGGVEVKNHMDVKLPTVWLNPQLFEQVFLNVTYSSLRL